MQGLTTRDTVAKEGIFGEQKDVPLASMQTPYATPYQNMQPPPSMVATTNNPLAPPPGHISQTQPKTFGQPSRAL